MSASVTLTQPELEALMLRQADKIQQVYESAFEQGMERLAIELKNAPGLNKLYEDVKTFHLAFEHPAPDKPQLQPLDRADKRGGWINDEVQELRDARTPVDQADAYIDIIYFAVGGLVELGIEPGPLWDIVQNANMAKIWPDGKPHFHPDGKVMKPEGWEAPEPQLIKEVLRQMGFGDVGSKSVILPENY